MKKLKRILAIFLTVFLLSTGSIGAQEDMNIAGEIASRYIQVIIDTIAEDYRFGADKEAMYKAVLDYVMKENPQLLEGAIKAATGTLDPYSDYFTQKELISFVESVQAAYVGIGVTIQVRENGVEVMEVNPLGGAYVAGILAGDVLVAVNGEAIGGKSLDDVTDMVRGEVGTQVALTLLRGDTTLNVVVTRSRIVTQTVHHRVEEGNVGYIQITEFATTTPEAVEAALQEFQEQGITRLVVDVRNNPGGTLGSAVSVLSLFVPKNAVLTKIEYNDAKRTEVITSEATFTKRPNRKIVILANENSASAAEMFSGTMQNLKLATVVGKTTFGKGSMQEFMGLRNPVGFSLGDIKLSVAEFTKPDGGKINGVGIEPDVRVSNVYEPYDDSSLTPMTISGKYTVGDKHEDVRAIEERLSVLGLFNAPADDLFDNATKTATERFQAVTGLYVYGVMDFTTQARLNDAIKDVEQEVDRQLTKALELLK